ncbi:hypothetical protein [Algibacillus agarilyticus]|uniref:hypothetical protein n=1 Tax=Algibacillus agarilyticus TaxID=2234133 RepID=UPI000DD0BE70|nr:hypothetical protein [Algibacillus agarilyticus]
MNDNTPEILKRLNITVDNRLEYSNHIEDQFGFSLGAEQRMRTYSQHVNIKRIAKLKSVKRYYAPPRRTLLANLRFSNLKCRTSAMMKIATPENAYFHASRSPNNIDADQLTSSIKRNLRLFKAIKVNK